MEDPNIFEYPALPDSPPASDNEDDDGNFEYEGQTFSKPWPYDTDINGDKRQFKLKTTHNDDGTINLSFGYYLTSSELRKFWNPNLVGVYLIDGKYNIILKELCNLPKGIKELNQFTMGGKPSDPDNMRRYFSIKYNYLSDNWDDKFDFEASDPNDNYEFLPLPSLDSPGNLHINELEKMQNCACCKINRSNWMKWVDDHQGCYAKGVCDKCMQEYIKCMQNYMYFEPGLTPIKLGSPHYVCKSLELQVQRNQNDLSIKKVDYIQVTFGDIFEGALSLYVIIRKRNTKAILDDYIVKCNQNGNNPKFVTNIGDYNECDESSDNESSVDEPKSSYYIGEYKSYVESEKSEKIEQNGDNKHNSNN